jgi:hypothetical protein
VGGSLTKTKVQKEKEKPNDNHSHFFTDAKVWAGPHLNPWEVKEMVLTFKSLNSIFSILGRVVAILKVIFALELNATI